MTNTLYAITLLANLLWFCAAFRYFSFQHQSAAKLLAPRPTRQSPLFLTLTAFTRFLGGMNGAFALLSIVLLGVWLMGSPLFDHHVERGVLLAALGAAHFSQFIFNVPVLRNGERQNGAYWPVKSGPMLFIFTVDAVLAVVNFAMSLVFLLA